MRLSICHSDLVRVINIPISGGVGRGNRATQLEQNESLVPLNDIFFLSSSNLSNIS